MAFQPPPPDDDRKKNRKSGVFGSLMQEVGDIVREVKQDLNDMTPPETAKKRHETSSKDLAEVLETVAGAQGGLATVDAGGDGEEESAPRAAPVKLGYFKGNPWELLGQPGRMRIGCGYLAAEANDILVYANKLRFEMEAPFTLGMVVAEPQVWESGWNLLEDEPRLFGATGYGPRSLQDDLQALDDGMTSLLNDNPKLIAVGLLGIDEPYAPYALKAQQDQMQLQLELAADFGVPAYLGHRRSLKGLTDVLARAAALPRMIWAEPLQDPDELALVLKHDMYILIRPELTHTSPAGLAYRELVAKVPPNRHLLSSGSTLSAPAGKEGERNNLSGLDASLKALAELMGEERPEVLQRGNDNAKILFYNK